MRRKNAAAYPRNRRDAIQAGIRLRLYRAQAGAGRRRPAAGLVQPFRVSAEVNPTARTTDLSIPRCGHGSVLADQTAARGQGRTAERGRGRAERQGGARPPQSMAATRQQRRLASSPGGSRAGEVRPGSRTRMGGARITPRYSRMDPMLRHLRGLGHLTDSDRESTRERLRRTNLDPLGRNGNTGRVDQQLDRRGDVTAVVFGDRDV